jgi:hypothetical protein
MRSAFFFGMKSPFRNAVDAPLHTKDHELRCLAMDGTKGRVDPALSGNLPRNASPNRGRNPEDWRILRGHDGGNGTFGGWQEFVSKKNKTETFIEMMTKMGQCGPYWLNSESCR